jgi:hypothetical protein
VPNRLTNCLPAGRRAGNSSSHGPIKPGDDSPRDFMTELKA